MADEVPDPDAAVPEDAAAVATEVLCACVAAGVAFVVCEAAGVLPLCDTVCCELLLWAPAVAIHLA